MQKRIDLKEEPSDAVMLCRTYFQVICFKDRRFIHKDVKMSLWRFNNIRTAEVFT